MNRRKARLPALVAVFAAVVIIFIIKPNDKPSDCFTWKVEINGSTFYLAGSVHTAKAENYPLPEVYMKCYKKADRAVFELKDNFDTLQQKIFRYAEKDRLQPDQYLNLFLDSTTVEALGRLFDKEKLKQYFQHDAWLLNMSIAGTRSKLIGYDPKLAVDKYFHELAEKDGKEIIGLDQLDDQIKLFEFKAPLEMQVKIIKRAVQTMEAQASAEAGLYEAYFNCDTAAFETEFLKTYDFDNPQMLNIYNRVFTERNTKWVDELEKLAADEPGTYFVLVGAGHYFGPNNVRTLLEEKGYTVVKQ